MAIRLQVSSDAYQDNTGNGVPFGDHTIACWAYMSVDRASLTAIVEYQNNTFSNWYILGTNTDRTVALFTSGQNVTSTYALSVGTWYGLAYTVSGTTGTVYAKTDITAISQVGTGTVTTHIPQQFRIGCTSNTSHFWNGRIAAVKCWTTALSQTDIDNELNQFDPVVRSGLLRYNKLRVPDLNDYSGNGWILYTGGTSPTTEDDPPIPDTLLPPVDNSLRGIISPDAKWL